MSESTRKPSGYLTFTLHAHLPWVVNHGTWPHGMEWLHEAAAETYLPMLRMLRRLERDGIPFQCNLDLSPVLLEQLAHPLFQAEFPKYLQRKIVAAEEDEAFFRQSGEQHYVSLAQMWRHFFEEAFADFDALGGDLIAGFRRFNDSGLIDLITCCATHGYLPLLGTDESVFAQIRAAITSHTRHLGRAPHGIWLPECGYRPAGLWSYPVLNADGSGNPAFERIGVEQAVRESGLDFFFVDTHLIEGSSPVRSPYGPPPPLPPVPPPLAHPEHDVYRPYLVAGPYRETEQPVTVFPRDPRTGVQVWSGELGYPGDSAYLDFHKKRWPGGHRYWRVTGPHVDIASKEPYLIELTSCRAYLSTDPAREAVALREGSWGAEGGDRVWLNPETSWTWSHIYPAERALRGIVSAGQWRETELGTRIVQQLCRELLLLESSDWQFLITTGAARDYAESRFLTHNDLFDELRGMWDSFLNLGELSHETLARLNEISARDSLFPDLDPTYWATYAHEAALASDTAGMSTAAAAPASALAETASAAVQGSTHP